MNLVLWTNFERNGNFDHDQVVDSYSDSLLKVSDYILEQVWGQTARAVVLLYLYFYYTFSKFSDHRNIFIVSY